MKILLLGDTHGCWQAANKTIGRAMAAHAGITHIFQVGDFGLFWPRKKRGRSTYNPVGGVPFHFIDGNHDVHPMLREWDKHPHHKNLIYQPRGSVLEIDGCRILFIGGATSVDRSRRQAKMALGHREVWWEEEIIGRADFETAMSHEGKIDCIVSHDRPDCFKHPFTGHNIDKERYGLSDRTALEGIWQKYKPNWHFFGHYHDGFHGQEENTYWQVCPMIGVYGNRYPYSYTIWDGSSVKRHWSLND
jgi:predicted phosphodiesterase